MEECNEGLDIVILLSRAFVLTLSWYVQVRSAAQHSTCHMVATDRISVCDIDKDRKLASRIPIQISDLVLYR